MLQRTIRGASFVALCWAVALGAHAKGLNEKTLGSWLKSYEAAWETRDAAAAGRIFTEDATYHDMVYKPAMQGRAAIENYWRTVTADHRDVNFESQVIAVQGNTGVAHWTASFKLASNGATVELDGVFVLEFDASGRCKALREWWFVKPE